MVPQWQVITPVGTAREQVPVLYGGNRLALVRHKFGHKFYLGSDVSRLERYCTDVLLACLIKVRC
jgi:hypothetical protein